MGRINDEQNELALSQTLAAFKSRRQLLEVQPRFSSIFSTPGAATAKVAAEPSGRRNEKCILKKGDLSQYF